MELHSRSLGLSVQHAAPAAAQLVRLIVPKPLHDAAWWAEATAATDLGSEDSMDFGAYNRITWTGVMGDLPYPAVATGIDLRENRERFFAGYR